MLTQTVVMFSLAFSLIYYCVRWLITAAISWRTISSLPNFCVPMWSNSKRLPTPKNKKRIRRQKWNGSWKINSTTSHFINLDNLSIHILTQLHLWLISQLFLSFLLYENVGLLWLQQIHKQHRILMRSKCFQKTQFISYETASRSL